MKKLTMLTLVGLLTGASVAFAHGGGGPKHLELLDENKDGKITKEEAQAKAKARFAEIDTNKDGKATKDELEAHHQAMRAKHQAERGPSETRRGQQRERGPKHEKMAQHMFDKADANGDGVIDSTEFALGALRMFERMDDDGNGVIENDELARKHGRRQCG